MPDKKDDSVKSALDEILGIETDRVKTETQERQKKEEDSRRAKEEAERRAREEEERRKREEAERIVAEERSRRDDESRKLHLRQLEEMRVKQEMEAKARLAEEEMRLKHEKDLAVIDAQKKKIPIWVWAVIGVILVGGGATGYVLYSNWQEEQETMRRQAAAAEAKSRAEREALEGKVNKLQNAARDAESERAALQAELQQRTDLTEAEQAALRDQLRAAEQRAAEAAAAAAAAAAAVESTGGTKTGGTKVKGGTKTGPAAPAKRWLGKCKNVGTPLEEGCFIFCPGDPRC